jgi:vanadium chloroperoxidase
MGTLPQNIPGRTINQTVVGIFWGYDGSISLGTPPRLYNQIVRKIAIGRNNTEAKNARLFALVNVAMADAGILAWDQKYIHNFWRPVVGIREHDTSMGLALTADNDLNLDCDSSWLPLGAQATNALNGEYVTQKTHHYYPHNQAVMGIIKNFTPNFPAYPSGHATFGAAAFHITRRFYGVPLGDTNGDNLFDDLDFVSDEFNGVNQDNDGTVRPRHLRNFPRGLWQMIVENGRSRVDLGVHWVFDAFAVDENNNLELDQLGPNGLKIGGVPLGLQIAEDIFTNRMSKSTVGPRP